MFTCKVENSKGEILNLTQNENNYQVINIDGTNPPSAILNMSKVAMMDGSRFNSSQLNERNLVLMIRLNGDIERNRIRLYSFFRSKELCRVYYANESRNVYIDGYVENVEVSPFSKSEVMQVSIICPNPYFRDINENTIELRHIFDNFEFPFAINSTGIPFSTIEMGQTVTIMNSSERETGLLIESEFNANCNKFILRKLSSNERITLNYNFINHDKLIINTTKGSKSIKLIRNATEVNVFPYLDMTSKFFQLTLGENIFDYILNDGSDNTKADVIIKYNFLYGGV